MQGINLDCYQFLLLLILHNALWYMHTTEQYTDVLNIKYEVEKEQL